MAKIRSIDKNSQPNDATYDWLEHWKTNDIAFHLNTVNPLLEKYWPKLNINKNADVLVPLCGKSLDLLWLANQGHHVIGVELSEIACEQFFIENNISFKKNKKGIFKHFYSDKIDLYCGDFFELSTKIISPIAAVYDRAALIALPEELRRRYAAHVMQLVLPKSQILLITLDSPNIVTGPPYPVPFQEVKNLFGAKFQITQLECLKKVTIQEHLQQKGYKEINEAVYHMQKKK